jgi:hypothetical protein
MKSGLYDWPGFSPTWLAAARASWLLLPSTKLANVNSGFNRGTTRGRAFVGVGRDAVFSARIATGTSREPTSTMTSVLASASSTTSRMRSR